MAAEDPAKPLDSGSYIEDLKELDYAELSADQKFQSVRREVAQTLGDGRVSTTLAGILARKYPGTLWKLTDSSSETAAGAVVLKLASPKDDGAIIERSVGASRTV